MRFYIPEIGDQIRLVSDWNFQLYNEHRNRKLWDLAKADKNPELAAWSERCDVMRAELRRLEALQLTKTVQEKNWRHGRFWNSNEPGFLPVEKKYWPNEADEKAHEETREMLWTESRNPHVSFSLPAGSLLSIDRIYIRKGVSDYSSITFYLKETTWKPLAAKKKKGATRFWAKLHDVNLIEFEHVPR